MSEIRKMNSKEKALLIESALRKLEDTNDKFADEIEHDWNGTIKKSLDKFRLYHGEIGEKRDYILNNFLDSNLPFDEIAPEAVQNLCDTISAMAGLINK